MDTDQIMEQAFIPLVKHEGLDGKLSEHEIAALAGVCHREISKELEIAAEFLRASPAKDSVMDRYERERAKEARQIMVEVETRSSTIDIGTLRGIRFTAPMWEVVKGCRVAGHFAKLDALANYYASRWGNPTDGTFSIDAHVNRPTSGAGAVGKLGLWPEGSGAGQEPAAAREPEQTSGVATTTPPRPMEATINCWRCKAPLPMAEETRGKNVRCPQCGTKQRLPV